MGAAGLWGGGNAAGAPGAQPRSIARSLLVTKSFSCPYGEDLGSNQRLFFAHKFDWNVDRPLMTPYTSYSLEMLEEKHGRGWVSRMDDL